MTNATGPVRALPGELTAEEWDYVRAALAQQPEGQGGGEVCIRCGDKPANADYVDPLTLRGLIEYVRVAANPSQGVMRWHAINLLAQALPHLQRLESLTALPPSAPVGVEGRLCALADELMTASEQEDAPSASIAFADASGRVRTLAEALAQQPAAGYPRWIGVDWAEGQQPAAVFAKAMKKDPKESAP